jgi:hypothetical protein
MQRTTALLFALLVLASLGVVLTKAGPAKVADEAPVDAGAAADASAAPADAGAPDEPLDAGVEAVDPGSPFAATGTSDAGTTLLSGEAAPALPAEAPKTVTFGVVLVTYRGAQGAPASARSRDAALELAKTLAADARADFAAAVAKGDKGSIANAGKIPRGVLEPAPEYVLFSLAKGDVSEPVDTPRGFWIVQRIE